MAAEYNIFPVSEGNAREITTWRYDPPYDLYDLAPRHLTGFLNPDYRYHQVLNKNGRLVGYCCFGVDAQVPGGVYLKNEPEILDIGVGLAPRLTGQGRGTAFVGEILKFGFNTYHPDIFRVSIASFNKRSLKTFQNLGFLIQGSFTRGFLNVEFFQLERPVMKAEDGETSKTSNPKLFKT